MVQRQRGLVYHMRSRWFDYTETFRTASSQGDQGVVCSVPIHLFQVVQPQRTSSNLFEPLQCRESKVCIGLSHEFGVVRLYEPFRTTSSQGDQGVGHLYTTSGQLNCSELPRNFKFSNHFSAEKAMYVRVSYMSLGWFDYTEPYIEPHLHKKIKVCSVPIPIHLFRVV